MAETHFFRSPRLKKVKPYGMSLLAGAGAALSLPPFSLVPAFLLMGYVLYQSITSQNWRQAALHMGLGGYGWFLTSLYWISHSLLVGEADYIYLLPLSFFGIPVIVALFWCAAGGAGFLIARTKQGRLMMLVTALGLAEWGREFIATGFPWNAPGLVFLAHYESGLLAAYFGQTGLNFLAFLTAAFVPFWYLSNSKFAKQMLSLSYALLTVVLGWLAFMHHNAEPILSDKQAPIIRLVQPNIAQSDKWVRTERAKHLAQLVQLSTAPSDHKIDLVIWPESAFAGNYSQEQDLMRDLASQIATHHQSQGGKGLLLAGVLRIDDRNLFRNSAVIISPDKKDVFYDKTHLVPFGEYVPWRALSFIDAIAADYDFTQGDAIYPLNVPSIAKILPLICYEAIFPALTGRATNRPEVIVNITNDGWFGHTAGPYQHLAQTKMTAISYGLPLLRVANTGISAAFSAKGKELAVLPLSQAGYLDVPMPPSLAQTPFATYRLMILFIFPVIGIVITIMLDRSRENRQ